MPLWHPVPTKGLPRQLCQGPWPIGHGPWQSCLGIGPSLTRNVSSSAGNSRATESVTLDFGNAFLHLWNGGSRFFYPRPLKYFLRLLHNEWLTCQCDEPWSEQRMPQWERIRWDVGRGWVQPPPRWQQGSTLNKSALHRGGLARGLLNCGDGSPRQFRVWHAHFHDVRRICSASDHSGCLQTPTESELKIEIGFDFETTWAVSVSKRKLGHRNTTYDVILNDFMYRNSAHPLSTKTSLTTRAALNLLSITNIWHFWLLFNNKMLLQH